MSKPKGQLPRKIFAKIAPHEFLVANLARESPAESSLLGSGTRPNGRSPDQGRPFDIHTGSLSQAHGSAAVRLDRTRVVCGVRGEILPVDNIPHYRPSAVATVPAESRVPGADGSASAAEIEADNRRQLRDYDLLVPNLELATGSAPEFLPGGAPPVLAQALSSQLYAMLHTSGLVDAERLKIWYQPPQGRTKADDAMEVEEEEEETEEEGPQLMAYWTLYIDILFLSFDGNPFDAAWAAIVAALRDTRLPHVRWDHDRSVAVCSSAARHPLAPLALRGLPVATTAVVCVENRKKQQQQQQQGARWILVDPDRLEEGQCRESATVVVDRSGGPTVVRAISKTGGILVGPRELHALVAEAEKRWDVLAAALDSGKS